MAKKNSGLGRGIDSIFLENNLDSEESTATTTIRVAHIDPKNDQPRKNFDAEALSQLADSIAAHGVLQPILVRRSALGRFQIVAGERRWRASKLAGITEIPAIIIEGDDKTVAQIAMIENVQREDLNPLEEAMGYRALISDYGMTQEELAAQIGKSRSAIANAMRLLDLPEELLSLVAAENITPGHARAILSLKNRSDMKLLADRIILAGLSVRDAEEAARRLNKRATDAEREEATEKEVKVDYVAELEKRVMQHLGRKVQITATRNKKSITLYYEDNEDLDELLASICGKDFMNEI